MFIIGGVFGMMAGIINTEILIIPSITSSNTTYSYTIIIGALIVAPFVEEIIKIAGIVFIKTQENINIWVHDWIELALFSALGFSVFENFLYFSQFLNSNQLNNALMLLSIRFLISTPLHLTTTSIAAYGIGNYDVTHLKKYLVYLLLAMIIHSMFNLSMVFIEGV